MTGTLKTSKAKKAHAKNSFILFLNKKYLYEKNGLKISVVKSWEKVAKKIKKFKTRRLIQKQNKNMKQKAQSKWWFLYFLTFPIDRIRR